MKKYYSLLGCVGRLAVGPVAPAAQGRVGSSGPVTRCIGAGGPVALPSLLAVGPGAALTNEGRLDFGGDPTNNGAVAAPTAGTSKALLPPLRNQELRMAQPLLPQLLSPRPGPRLPPIPNP